MTIVLAVVTICVTAALVALAIVRTPEQFASIAGRYARRDVLVIAVHGLGLGALVALWASGQLDDAAGTLQDRGWAAVAIAVALVVVAWRLVTIPRDVDLRPSWWQRRAAWRWWLAAGLVVAAVGLVTVSADSVDPRPSWMAATTGVLVAGALVLVAAEALAQLGVATRTLPGRHRIWGTYVPHAPVYVAGDEGVRVSGRTNERGWPTRPFRLDAGRRRIVVLGDDHVQGLEVPLPDRMGPQLERQLADCDDGPEVCALGLPGFGPGVALSPTRMRALFAQFSPDDVVVVIALASDLETTSGPDGYRVHHLVTADGGVEIHPESADPIHDLKHFVLPAYQPDSDPVGRLAILRAQVLLPKVMPGLLGRGPRRWCAPRPHEVPSFAGAVMRSRRLDPTHVRIEATDLVATPGRSDAVFAIHGGPALDHAVAVMAGLLAAAAGHCADHGAVLRVVTVPAFCPAFFDQPDDAPWSPRIGELDLLAPERALLAVGDRLGIEVVALGHQLADDGRTVSEIAGLYLRDGTGHLSSAGHAWVADHLARSIAATRTPPSPGEA